MAGALVLALGLLGLGFLINAVGAHPPRGTHRVGQAVGTVGCLGLLVLCSRWAIHVEHRLRRGQPVAQAFESRPAASPARARRTRRGRRTYGPVGTGVILSLFVLATAGSVAAAVSVHAQAVRSSFVQEHGTRSIGIVGSVVNTEHCSRSGCNFTAAISVTLPRSVDAGRTTVVHYPGYSNLLSGEPVAVLVDPQQPGYAELPGSRFQDASSWIILVILAVLLAGVSAAEGRALRHLLGHRRHHRAQTDAGLLKAGG